MFSYCLNCEKNTESKNPKVVKTKNGTIMLSSNYATCGSKNRDSLNSKKQKGG